MGSARRGGIPIKSWNKLDNAAILFSAATHRAETQVFRFSCELKEPVDEFLLQKALDTTIADFEAYRYVMKRGFFWYYLEESDMRPEVREEYKPVCGQLYRTNKKMLLFEVTYFRAIINIEVFHVLSDGAGAIKFFEALVINYLSIKKGLSEEDARTFIKFTASKRQMRDDSFTRYCTGGRKLKINKNPKALKLRGFRYTQNRLKLIRAHISTREILAQARKYNATVTAYLCGCMMKAISEEIPIRRKKKPLVISVPVNLRNFFESASIRNFFNVVLIPYDLPKTDHTLEEMIATADKCLKEKTTPENLINSMNSYVSIERNIAVKLVPLIIKDIVLKYAYLISQRSSTAILSNVGIISMPPAMADSIKAFDVCASTNKMQLCFMSFQEVMSIGITTPYINSEIQRRFFKQLTDNGIKVEISSNIQERREKSDEVLQPL